MNRRELLILGAGAAIARPLAARSAAEGDAGDRGFMKQFGRAARAAGMPRHSQYKSTSQHKN